MSFKQQMIEILNLENKVEELKNKKQQCLNSVSNTMILEDEGMRKILNELSEKIAQSDSLILEYKRNEKRCKLTNDLKPELNNIKYAVESDKKKKLEDYSTARHDAINIHENTRLVIEITKALGEGNALITNFKANYPQIKTNEFETLILYTDIENQIKILENQLNDKIEKIREDYKISHKYFDSDEETKKDLREWFQLKIKEDKTLIYSDVPMEDKLLSDDVSNDKNKSFVNILHKEDLSPRLKLDKDGKELRHINDDYQIFIIDEAENVFDDDDYKELSRLLSIHGQLCGRHYSSFYIVQKLTKLKKECRDKMDTIFLINEKVELKYSFGFHWFFIAKYEIALKMTEKILNAIDYFDAKSSGLWKRKNRKEGNFKNLLKHLYLRLVKKNKELFTKYGFFYYSKTSNVDEGVDTTNTTKNKKIKMSASYIYDVYGDAVYNSVMMKGMYRKIIPDKIQKYRGINVEADEIDEDNLFYNLVKKNSGNED